MHKLLALITGTILILVISACQGNGNGNQSNQTGGEDAMMTVPAEYANLSSPLSITAETIKAGEQIFLSNCASCHGDAGKGDGPVSRALKPQPSDLSVVGASVDEAYLYWRIAEGGAEVGSSMPAWKSILTEEEIWMGVAFIQNLANK